MLRIITILLCWLVASFAVTSVHAQRTGNPEKDAELAYKHAEKRGNLLKIADNAPDRYKVVKGDTLWDIASKFLLDPWRWPELWRNNRNEIKDPHLIYPGDVLVLDRKKGTLSIERADGSGATQDGKLSPSVRSEPIQKAIPVVPANVIEPYLTRSLALESQLVDGKFKPADVFDNAPMVIGGRDGRTYLSQGDVAYVTGLKTENIDWVFMRPGRELRDPDNGELRGTEAVFLGRGKVIRRGDPAEVVIEKSRLEVQKGDRLIVEARSDVANFQLKSPAREVDAKVMSLYGNATDVGGLHAIITLNKGKADGLDIGNVLALYKATNSLTYRPDGSNKDLTVTPTDDRYGLVTVFRVGDRMSYALVVQTKYEVVVGDSLRSPQAAQ